MKNRRTFNPKRRIRKATGLSAFHEQAERVSYGGNPEHKMNPGDFGLVPPAAPRPGKTLCDAAAIFTREEALHLLRDGFRKGLVSVREVNGWPQNVWAVAGSSRVPLEAMLENPLTGAYHGYPMQESDPLSEEVVQRWFGEQP